MEILVLIKRPLILMWFIISRIILFSCGTYIDLELIKDSIPNLISQEDNQMLTKIPTDLEINDVVFNMNIDGAPGPDGFLAFFFLHY